MLSLLLVTMIAFGIMCFPSSPLNATAATELYTYTTVDGNAAITSVDRTISGDVVIPSTLGGYPVTKIGSNTFYSCDDITSVVIPEGVTEIGYASFRDCKSLKSISLPASLESISEGMFLSGCPSLETIDLNEDNICFSLYNGALILNKASLVTLLAYPATSEATEYTIPEDVKKISGFAFDDCINLKVLNIPSSVETIGDGFIKGCVSLEKINLMDENQYVKKIGDAVYYYNHLLALPACCALTEFTIPETVTSVRPYAFYGCESLEAVCVPAGLNSIERYSFANCTNLRNIYFSENSNVNYIGDNAFKNCSSLIAVSIPEKVTVIYRDTFFGCKSLEEVTLHEGLTEIEETAFLDTKISVLRIPSTVTNIELMAYVSDCFVGYDVDFENPVYASDEYGVLYNKEKTVLIHAPNNPDFVEYVIPEGVETIGTGAFYLNEYIKRIKIPQTLKNIESVSFHCTVALEEFVFSGNVDMNAFTWPVLYSAKEIIIHENVNITSANIVIPGMSLFDLLYSPYSPAEKMIIYDRNMTFSQPWFGLHLVSVKDEYRDVFLEALKKYTIESTKLSLYGIYGTTEPSINEEWFNEPASYDFCINGLYFKTNPNAVMYCYRGSTAEEYAKTYNIKIKYIGEECLHPEMEVVPVVAATCTTDGLTAGSKCSVCGEMLVEQEIIPATGHNYTPEITITATHTNEGVKTFTCTCGDVYTETIDKIAKHTYTSEVLEEVQCEKDGKVVYVCECGDSYTEKIPALGHVDEDGNRSCDRCGTTVCDHLCHKDGILGFFWKIIRIFQKLFGMNPVCECGAAHY